MARFGGMARFAPRMAVAVLAFLLVAASEKPAIVDDASVASVTVKQPWARDSAGRSRVGVAYLTIVNDGIAPDRLLTVSTPAAKRASLHRSVIRDGIARMRLVDTIDIPPGAELALEPGGLHVMLMGLEAPLKRGQSFPLSLVFERAGEIDVEVEVLKPGSMGPDGG